MRTTLQVINQEKLKMEDYQQRVMNEKVELDSKIEKLDEFIKGVVFEDVDPFEQGVMMRQLRAMRSYSQALGERIQIFLES